MPGRGLVVDGRLGQLGQAVVGLLLFGQDPVEQLVRPHGFPTLPLEAGSTQCNNPVAGQN